MADDPETYLAVLKALYDYEPEPDAEDELAIKENQVLFLVERVDDELSTALNTSILQVFLSNFQSLSLAGGRSNRNRMTKPLLAWSPQHTLNKYGPGHPWHSIHHRLSFRLTV